jgi:hypothetical protein
MAAKSSVGLHVQRFEMQGFIGCHAPTLRAIRPWLRVGPAICGASMAMGLMSGNPIALWVLAPFAALGAILPVHPVDIPYNFVIRRWTGTPAIPSYGRPRRFSCGLAAIWISATACALASGFAGIAMMLGSIFVTLSAVYVTSDFCFGSWIYQRWRQLYLYLMMDRGHFEAR